MLEAFSLLPPVPTPAPVPGQELEFWALGSYNTVRPL